MALGTRLVQWDVDASGAWETPTNWTDDAVPGPGDVVVIDRPAGNFVVTIGAPTAAVASLLSREALNVFKHADGRWPRGLRRRRQFDGDHRRHWIRGR